MLFKNVFIINVLFLSLFVFSMELQQASHFVVAASDAKKEVFLRLLNDQNKFEGFKEFLKCRRVCKQWKIIIDAIYQKVLADEQKLVTHFYNEFMHTSRRDNSCAY